jgi:trehalose-phosphatase
MLDYDGTLAPFHVNRKLALPLPRSLELVGAIAAEPHMSVGVVSGRPLSEIARLLGPLSVTLVGEHGWEMRLRDGSVLQHPVSAALVEMLDRAERAALDRGMGGLLERKRTGLVFHTRGVVGAELARELEDQAWTLWQTLAEGEKVRLQRIDGGVELRLRGWNKGTAVLSLISQSPEGTLAVFIGDDVTDEDAFEVVQGFGFGVRVGASDQRTVAAAHLPTCASVAEFLEEWLRVVRDASGGADRAPPQRRA